MTTRCEQHVIPHLGHPVTLVPRQQLRRATHGRTFRMPRHLRSLMTSVPQPPAVFSWARRDLGGYPILGNDRYGNCYYTAICHQSQTWTKNNGGPECLFDAAAVSARYLALAGGDNGLTDAQVMPEWRSGVVGPHGPHAILDEMTLDPLDLASVDLALWAFCGLLYAAALPDAWLADPRPGDTWSMAAANPNNGHVMHLTGKNARGGYDVETWGFARPINLTPDGLQHSDPELIVAFSLDMFHPHGHAPNSMLYEQSATLWQQCGGRPLPPSPFTPTPGVKA